MEHHDITALMAMARRRDPSAHLDHCAFCREQYAYALELLDILDGNGLESFDREGLDGVGPRAASYRLAAQTGEAVAPLFRLRRTWYLQNNAVILRVIEDTVRQRLTGYLISEPDPEHRLRVRFDGLKTEFQPDRNGVFDIGAASIDIEPMNVTLVS